MKDCHLLHQLCSSYSQRQQCTSPEAEEILPRHKAIGSGNLRKKRKKKKCVQKEFDANITEDTYKTRPLSCSPSCTTAGV